MSSAADSEMPLKTAALSEAGIETGGQLMEMGDNEVSKASEEDSKEAAMLGVSGFSNYETEKENGEPSGLVAEDTSHRAEDLTSPPGMFDETTKVLLDQTEKTSECSFSTGIRTDTGHANDSPHGSLVDAVEDVDGTLDEERGLPQLLEYQHFAEGLRRRTFSQTDAEVLSLRLRSVSNEGSSELTSTAEEANPAGESDDEVSNLGSFSRRAEVGDILPSKIDSELNLYYPDELDLGEVINPYSLEERIRLAREEQDLALGWEAEILLPKSVSKLQDSHFDEPNTSIPELEQRSPDQQRSASVELHLKEKLTNKTSGIGEALLFGALASGVNGPTWVIFRLVLVALIASLVLLLYIASQSANTAVVIRVLVLFFFAGGLIVLVSWFISEVGLVSVERQMAELNLTD